MTLKKACDILKIKDDATLEEALASYEAQKLELRDKRMEPGSVGNEASKKLDLLDEAYSKFCSVKGGSGFDSRQSSKGDENVNFGNTGSGEYGGCSYEYREIEEKIKAGDLNAAQALLDDVADRSAEWHYYQSIIYYKKSWFIESKKQLEMCINLDPGNQKYRNSLDKLDKIISSKSVSPDKMSSGDRSRPVYDNVNTGNGTCTGSCCGDVCLANMCCDLCRCFCR